MNTIPLQLVQSSMPRRETVGECVRRRRNDLRLTREQVAEKATSLGGKVSESFVRDLEIDRFPSPGIKSVEYVARALEMPPLDLMALSLDEPTGEVRAGTDFDRLRKLYEETQSERLRTAVEETIQMLIDRLSKG